MSLAGQRVSPGRQSKHPPSPEQGRRRPWGSGRHPHILSGACLHTPSVPVGRADTPSAHYPRTGLEAQGSSAPVLTGRLMVTFPGSSRPRGFYQDRRDNRYAKTSVKPHEEIPEQFKEKADLTAYFSASLRRSWALHPHGDTRGPRGAEATCRQERQPH